MQPRPWRPLTAGEIRQPGLLARRVRRWKAWARALRARFRAAVRRRGAAAMVWPRRPAVTPERRLELHFAPRLELHFAPRLAVAGRPAAADRPPGRNIPPAAAAGRRVAGAGAPARRPSALAPAGPGRRDRAAPAPPELTLRRRQIAPEVRILTRRADRVRDHLRLEQEASTLVRRIVHRRRRVEERTLPGIERHLHRPPVPPPAARAEAVWRPAAGGPARRTPATAPATPPPVDVGALTDQVMRHIDRRLTAWRERTGRI